MALPIEPAGNRMHPLRLASGVQVLEDWSAHATQVEKNIVHNALMAVADGSVFRRYLVIDDADQAMEFFVLARAELTVKIRVHSLAAFGIVFIGDTCDAPGLDHAAPEVEPSGPRDQQHALGEDRPGDSNRGRHRRGTPHPS